MLFSRASLYEHDRTWAWKAVLRVIAIILDLVGIGLTGWAISNALNASTNNNYENSNYYSNNYDIAEIPWNLASFSLSFIWCLTNLCILLSRSQWIHPGANVGCDLFLWLAFIVTALFSTGAAVQDLLPYDDYYDDSLGSYTSDGTTYAYYPNGTSYEVTPSNPAPPCPGFTSCASKSALQGALHKRGVVVATASAFAWVMVLIHFALFVSACRYTHERRKWRVADEKLRGEAEKIEERVIRRLEAEGRLRTPPEAAPAAPEMTTATGAGPVGADQQHTGYESVPLGPPQIRVDPATGAGPVGSDQQHAGYENVPVPPPLHNVNQGQDVETGDRISYA